MVFVTQCKILDGVKSSLKIKRLEAVIFMEQSFATSQFKITFLKFYSVLYSF